METSIQDCTVVPSQCDIGRKGNKAIQVRMEEIKLFAEDMLTYVESPKKKKPQKTL